MTASFYFVLFWTPTVFLQFYFVYCVFSYGSFLRSCLHFLWELSEKLSSFFCASLWLRDKERIKEQHMSLNYFLHVIYLQLSDGSFDSDLHAFPLNIYLDVYICVPNISNGSYLWKSCSKVKDLVIWDVVILYKALGRYSNIYFS
jgi:hypothetical protein